VVDELVSTTLRIAGLINCSTTTSSASFEIIGVNEICLRSLLTTRTSFWLGRVFTLFFSGFVQEQHRINQLQQFYNCFVFLKRPTMPCKMEDEEQGYDVNRFVGEVRNDLLCFVCHDVPKDPRLCQNKDHIFCLAHISRHLHQNSNTCPVCRDPLTPETLKRPTRILKNYLEDRKIKCDHHDRGCPDVVRLEDLQRHVDQCGFAPVMCRNEGCETEVNKSDKENHEKNLCQFRIAKCHDCRDIKASQNEMKTSQNEMKASQDELKASQNEINVQNTRMEDEIKVRPDFLRLFH
jgi:hypothetical protein